MRPLLIAAALAALLSSSIVSLPGPAGSAPPAQDAEPVRPVARVNGVALEAEGFEAWLLRTHGWRHLDDYVDRELLRQELERLGLAAPTAADLDQAFERDWQDQLLLRRKGGAGSFEAELQAAGIDRQGYRDRRFGSLELDVMARAILRQRPPTETQLRELWAREFGPDGQALQVRVAWFDKLKEVRPGQVVDKAAAEELDARARTAADKFLAAVSRDRSKFPELARTDSDPLTVPRFDSYLTDVRAAGGLIERLRSDHFGGVLAAPLAQAKPGDLVGPVVTSSGYYVVELLAREPAPYETSAELLRRIWQERDPSPGEAYALRRELRAAAKVERFPLAPESAR